MGSSKRYLKNKLPVVLQQEQSDCGVACLLSIIKYYGGCNTADRIRRLSGTDTTGTTLLGLYQASCKLGFTSKGAKMSLEGLMNHKKPCILHFVLDGELEHFVVFYGVHFKSHKAIIGDPARGLKLITFEELAKMWKLNYCLLLDINEDFAKEKANRSAKIKWIFQLVKDDYSLLSIGAVIGIAISFLSLSMAIFSQRLIDDILPSRDGYRLQLYIFLLFILILFKEFISVVRQEILILQTRSFNIRIVDFFFNHLLRLPKPFFDTRKIGDLIARLNDTSRIQRVICQIASNTGIDFLMVIVLTTVIFTYSEVVGFICIGIIPIYYLLIYINSKKIIDSQRNIMVAYAKAESNYISTLLGIAAIKGSNKEKLYADRNLFIYKEFQKRIYSFGRIQIRLSFIINLLGVLFLVSILYYGGNLVLSGQLKAGQFIALFSLCGSLLPCVASLALITIPISEAKIAFDRMFEFIGIEKEKAQGIITLSDFHTIEVKDVLFRFPGRSPLLKKISFEVKRGTVIALLGENGCGKSTIIEILQKNYAPESGQVIINGSYQLDEIATPNWRTICAIVPQSIHIFNGTVLENIAFDDATEKAEEVISFLKDSGFMPFLDILPQSFQTIVGEEGINLSGGQRQLIGIIRALYIRPQLLILDEATSALDKESEMFVLNLIKLLHSKMGIIFITHKLHILKNFCDNIYVIEDGRINCCGTHIQLMETQNLYSSYWRVLS